jgi:two-component system, chemotaxis family, sensor kinase CheA
VGALRAAGRPTLFSRQNGPSAPNGLDRFSESAAKESSPSTVLCGLRPANPLECRLPLGQGGAALSVPILVGVVLSPGSLGSPMMTYQSRLPIPIKLLLLAGFPVVGALVLSLMLARDAQLQARSAEALGTVEDLAQLSVTMSEVIRCLQDERAQTALDLAKSTKDSEALRGARLATDRSVGSLEAFLTARDIGSLPARLTRNLGAALESLKQYTELRQRADDGQLRLGQLLESHAAITSSLINANAALTQLTNDGELLRNIMMLVGVLEVTERMSREHALLANVFAVGAFPPGTYRELVTLGSEQQVYLDALRASATDEQNRELDRIRANPLLSRAKEMRERAQKANEDESLGVSAEQWFATEQGLIATMRHLETELAQMIRATASAKIANATRAKHTSWLVSMSVVLVSVLMATMIGHRINRSIRALAKAANDVRQTKDFSVRAVRCSNDELGILTESFNEMLSGIQARDHELDDHRQNLERMIEARTEELAQRNRAMRIVLDTVEQGLVTILPDGRLDMEQSSAFSAWFPNAGGKPFFDALAADENVRATLRIQWEAVIEAFLPLEVCLDQMTKTLRIGDRHFSLGYRPVVDGTRLLGVLLIVSDIAAEVARLEIEAQHREVIGIFEQVLKDRHGFMVFAAETEQLVDELKHQANLDDATLFRVLHTLKGNLSLYGVKSVADVCHHLESSAVEDGIDHMRQTLGEVGERWKEFTARIMPLVGGRLGDMVEIHDRELDEIISDARRLSAASSLVARLMRLKFEPIASRFERVADQAKRLAKRLDKGNIHCIIDDGNVKLPRERWERFFQSLGHVVRNAVDHGLETETERVAAGKTPVGSLTFRAREADGRIVIEVSDDGQGIDWGRIRSLSRKKGLKSETDGDLVQALFVGGISTRDAATEHSGRGLGMSAVWVATCDLSGQIEVRSTSGNGTTFTFSFPASNQESA